MKTILRTPQESRNIRHDENTFFECCDCKQILPTRGNGCGMGYAVYPEENALVCYECTDKREREAMKTADKFFAYVSSDGKTLTTWTGGPLGRVYFGKRHPWSRERYYISAVDIHGQHWHGTGAPGMYAILKKCKS